MSRNILLAPLWLVAVVAAIIIIPVVLLGMLVLGLIAWACGAHVKIKESGREIGYVQWFKFHRYDHNGLAGPLELTHVDLFLRIKDDDSIK